MTQQCCSDVGEQRGALLYNSAGMRNRCGGVPFFGDYAVHREGNLIQFSEVFKLFFRVLTTRVNHLRIGRVPLMDTIIIIHSTFQYIYITI